MADPVSLLYLILSVVSVTKEATSLFNTIRHVDQKLDQQYYRLVAEREVTEAWANQIRLTAGDDLRAAIPREKYEEVRTLLDKIKMYYARADAKYSKTFKSVGVREGVPGVVTRAKYALAGHEELKDLVDVIKSMNKALKAIAPPLPPYAAQMYTGLSGPSALSAHMNDGVTALAGRSSSYPTTRTTAVGSGSSFGPTLVASTSDQPTQSMADRTALRESPSELEDHQMENHSLHLPSLKAIYNLCSETLKEIATRWDDKQLKNARSRLRLWGAGLFEPPAALDKVLATDVKSSNATRQAMLSMMANLLVLAERDLDRLRLKTTGVSQTKVASLETEVSSMLGTDELVESSLLCWADFMQEKYLQDQYGTREDHAQHFDRQRLSPDSISSVGPRPDEHIRDANSISRTVETLFDLLPAIRMERRQFAYQLGLFEKQKEKSHSRAEIVNGDDDDAAVIEDLDKIESFIRKQDERASKQGRKAGHYISPFQKQRMRLEQLQESAKMNKLREPKIDIDSDEIKAKKEDIRKTIAALVAQINTRSHTKTQTSSHKTGDDKQGKEVDTKTPMVPDKGKEAGIMQSVGISPSNTETLAIDILEALKRTAI